jgi:hypothetical protein
LSREGNINLFIYAINLLRTQLTNADVITPDTMSFAFIAEYYSDFTTLKIALEEDEETVGVRFRVTEPELQIAGKTILHKGQCRYIKLPCTGAMELSVCLQRVCAGPMEQFVCLQRVCLV